MYVSLSDLNGNFLESQISLREHFLKIDEELNLKRKKHFFLTSKRFPHISSIYYKKKNIIKKKIKNRKSVRR